jgi:glycosyltransferase involved in cell wall biosynthesis
MHVCLEKIIKIVHIIVGLNTGGAELMLRKILLNDISSDHQVVSLTSLGSIGESLIKNDIKVTALGLTKFNILVVFFRLVAFLLKTKPNVVQTWMYHSDFLGGIAAKLCGVNRIFWNIRNTEIPQRTISLTGLVVRLCSILSRFIPDKIICCANASKDRHIELGYSAKKIIVIPNGYKIIDRNFDIDFEKKIRKNLNIAVDAFVIGMVGRFDYLKGYDILIEAASLLTIETNKKIIFLCAGRGVDWRNQSIVSQVINLGVEKNFRLIGEVSDVDMIFSVMDIFCLSSRSEGFPNVVAEAMLNSLPCVVTDVGDAAFIVGDHGLVVPPNNHLALSNGIIHFLKMDPKIRKSIGAQGRIKIIENYNLDVIVEKYIKEYTGECQNEKPR